MRTLVTFPGRAGDVIWMLPTARAISESLGEPVDLVIAGEFASMVPLLQKQSYLGSVEADSGWSMSQDWQWPRRELSGHRWTQVIELGYRRWPEQPLPYETFSNWDGGIATHLDLTRPWIEVQPKRFKVPFTIGFTETYFELKVGLCELLKLRYGLRWPISESQINLSTGGRWKGEVDQAGATWEAAAAWIKTSSVFLGDCSAMHVLAVAMGVPVVLCEPMEARWNPIFYPLGIKGSQVTLITGLDGKPTFDARHVAEALEPYLP